ncbi:11361_t:CDS:2, partial [Rhizophagus irregularis]
MAFNVFGKNSGNKDSLPATNPQQSTKPSSILGAAGFAFKTNSPGIKSFSTEKIFHNSRPLNSEIDEGSDSSEDEDDETTGSDSDDSVTRVEPVKPKSNIQNKNNKFVNNVNDNRGDKAPSVINKKPHATNIISDFSNFEFHSKLRALGGRAGNENFSQSEISFGNKKSKSNNLNSSKSDFVSGTTANLQKKKVNNMMTTEEQSYNRSDIRSDVSWGSDPGQQQQSSPQVKSPTVKVNPNFIIEGQGFTPKLSSYINNNAPSYHHTNTNEWNTKSSKSLDSRSEIMYGGRDKDKVISSRHINPVIRNPRFNSSPGIPKTMSDITYQPKELRTEASNYDNPGYPSYGGNLNQRKPTVQVSARIPYSIDESTSYSGARVINQQQHKPKLLELHLSNKELLTLNKSLEEQISEQSSELENLSSFESLIKAQKEQLEHINSLENIIKDLTTKLSEQETQIKTIKDDDNEQNKKTKATLFYDPRNLPLHTLPRIIFDR